MIEIINTLIESVNSVGQGFWSHAASIFIQASVLIVLLLVIDLLLQKRVRAVFRYCLWMLLFVKLLLPASLALPTGIGYWLGDYFKRDVSIAQSMPQAEELVPAVIDMQPVYVPMKPSMMSETVAAGVGLEGVSWQGLVFLGWAFVMGVLLASLVRRAFLVRELIFQSIPAKGRLVEIADECRCLIGIGKEVELRLSVNAHSPVVCGLLKPIILMPAALLERMSREELKAVLTHELAHVKRADIWVNLLQAVLQIVYFYNPLVWIANAMVRRAREQAVDEMVLVTLKPEARNYSNTLIDIAEMASWRPNANLRLVSVVESKKALERRIKHMLNRPAPKSSRLGFWGLVAIIAIGAIAVPMGCRPLGRSNPEGAMEISSDDNMIVAGERVGDYVFGMSKDDILERLGEPRGIFYGDKKYTLGNLPERYFMSYGDISFGMKDDSVTGLTALSPFYKFSNGLGVGSSEEEIKGAFGDDFHVREFKVKDFLGYEHKGVMFEIKKSDRTVMEVNIFPADKKADIPKTSKIDEEGRIVDKTDYPFVNDPKVIGGWKSVDFVGEIGDFNPRKKNWGSDFWLNHFVFEEGGKIAQSGLKWTRGLILSDDTASKYVIKEMDGSTYMFYEWKSGDYTIRHMKPSYYVLKKVPVESLKSEPMFGEKADIPATTTIDERGRLVDKLDYPFVNDRRVIGTWKSVDFVGEIREFEAGERQWKAGDLYLKELIFLPEGKTFKPWWTWTKGLVFHAGDKTAAKYIIKDIEGSTYMFFEWKSGDYSIRHMKPSWYVLKKASSASP